MLPKIRGLGMYCQDSGYIAQKPLTHPPMGFPCHKKEEYLGRVLNLGYPVVIIHETENYLGRIKQRLPVAKLFKQGVSGE